MEKKKEKKNSKKNEEGIKLRIKFNAILSNGDLS